MFEGFRGSNTKVGRLNFSIRPALVVNPSLPYLFSNAHTCIHTYTPNHAFLHACTTRVHTHTYSHYKVVVVSTGNIGIDTRTEVLDSRLLPASQNLTNYYAAGAIMVGDLQTTFSVGNGQISILNEVAFENVRLSADQPYVFFVRLYSSEMVSYIYI